MNRFVNQFCTLTKKRQGYTVRNVCGKAFKSDLPPITYNNKSNPFKKKNCLSTQRKYAQTTKDWEDLSQKHPICDITCQSFCVRKVIDDCLEKNSGFCSLMCNDECYYLGPLSLKTWKFKPK